VLDTESGCSQKETSHKKSKNTKNNQKKEEKILAKKKI